ncbi:MAG: hypothetical protein ABEJ70_07325 [Halobacteriaceae archaeon]
MTPPRDGSDAADRTRPAGETDGGAALPGMDEDRLYAVVRTAVEDAILGAIGTVLLSLVGLVLVWIGLAMAFAGRGPAAAVAGVALALFGVYLAAATLGVIPSVGSLLRGR